MGLFNSTANKLGTVYPSMTTRMNSLNGVGKSWDTNFKYFKNDYANFSEMTPK